MEELRPVADRLVTTLFNRKQLKADHFDRQISGAVLLNEPGRQIVLSAWHDHRHRSVHHKPLGMDTTHAMLPHLQARQMARHLSGDTPSFTGHLG